MPAESSQIGDRAAVAAELEWLDRLASPGPWVMPRSTGDDRHRGDIYSRCKGWPEKPVAKVTGQQDFAERDANARLVCLLRSNLPTILEALRSSAGGAETAESFARRVHAGQTDQAEQPYTGHLGRVAARARAYAEARGWCAANAERAEAIGWLHDTLEDRRATASEIDTAFEPIVAYAVGVLTRDEGEPYAAYIEGIVIGGGPLARVVKLADLDDNLDPSRGPIRDKLRQRYERARAVLREALGLPASDALTTGGGDV